MTSCTAEQNLPVIATLCDKFSYVLQWNRRHIPVTYQGVSQIIIDSLRAGRSGDRIPVGARFSASVQTGPGDHPLPYKMGTGSLSCG
jgi:hypothetical protein